MIIDFLSLQPERVKKMKPVHSSVVTNRVIEYAYLCRKIFPSGLDFRGISDGKKGDRDTGITLLR